MILDPQKIATREKLILTGLYLAKYDAAGLKKLGFESFVEAFNVIGYALGQKPASIKNYRDEFDPLFPNRRRGWHKRPTRAYCLKVFEDYKSLDLQTFTDLIKSFAGYDENAWSELQPKREKPDGESNFAVAEGGEDFVGGLLDAVPEGGFGREEVARALDGLEFGFCGHRRLEEVPQAR